MGKDDCAHATRFDHGGEVILAGDVENVFAVDDMAAMAVPCDEEADHVVFVAALQGSHEGNRLVASAIDEHGVKASSVLHAASDDVVCQNHADACHHQHGDGHQSVQHK